MFQAQRLRYDAKTLVDHTHPEGPNVTGLRAMLLQGRFKHLRAAGLYEEYFARLPGPHADIIVQTLASSWIPVETAIAHYVALDSLELSESQLARMAEPLGATLFETLFATMLRAARASGAEFGIWAGLSQADRVWNRMYNGGGCKITQVGPKDALFEINGVPFATSRAYRASHCGFLRGVIAMTARVCVVKAVPKESRSDRYTVALSWV
jgi:hypothetical protein